MPKRDITRTLLIVEGVLLLYTFFYAYLTHFQMMLHVHSKYLNLSPIFPITSFGVLGAIFIYSAITNTVNVVVRALSVIAGFIAIMFIFIQGFTIATATSLLAAAALPGFPFQGGLLIHIIFEHTLGGVLGLLLGIKPRLLIQQKLKVRRGE